AGSHPLPWRPPHGPARGARRSEKMTLGTDSEPRPDSRPHIRETDPEALSARARVGLWVVLVAIAAFTLADLATATTLPWGPWPQLVSVTVAVLAIAVGDHAVHGTLAGASPHMAVGPGRGLSGVRLYRSRRRRR